MHPEHHVIEKSPSSSVGMFTPGQVHDTGPASPSRPVPQPLTSWKEIAAYMGKGVRTVQRWERECHFPVRRPSSDRHIVMAYPHEIDVWVTRRAASEAPEQQLQRLWCDLMSLVQVDPMLRNRAMGLCA